MNKDFLVGRVGQNPEVRFTKSGKAVCNLSIAVNSKTKRGNGYVDTVTWHRVVLWQGLAEDAKETLKKGSLIRIQGFEKTRNWTGRDGETRPITELIADKFEILDSLPQSAPSNLRPNGPPSAQIPGPEWDSV
jgi:single-strand DNA-binding protein